MLFLTRKVGERIRINEETEVSVLAIRNDRVRLGIEAPRSVHIVRSELVEQPPAICPNNKAVA